MSVLARKSQLKLQPTFTKKWRTICGACASSTIFISHKHFESLINLFSICTQKPIKWRLFLVHILSFNEFSYFQSSYINCFQANRAYPINWYTIGALHKQLCVRTWNNDDNNGSGFTHSNRSHIRCNRLRIEKNAFQTCV